MLVNVKLDFSGKRGLYFIIADFLSIMFISNVMAKWSWQYWHFCIVESLLHRLLINYMTSSLQQRFIHFGCGIKKKSVGKSTCLMTGRSNLTSELLRFLCAFVHAKTRQIHEIINAKAFQ